MHAFRLTSTAVLHGVCRLIWSVFFRSVETACVYILLSIVLSLVRRLKHTVLPYNYLYMYACLCARAAWCREGLNTGRKKLFTARPGPIFRLGAKVLSLVLLQKNQKNKTKKNKKKVLYGRNSYWNGIYRYFSKIFTMRKSYVIF